MHLRNKSLPIVTVLLLFAVITALRQTQYPPAPPPANRPQSAPNQPQGGVQNKDTVQLPAQQPQDPSTTDNGVFVFKKTVEEVILHATVVDDKGKLVTTLDRNAFTVFEDDKPQPITSFRREDIPVSLGIVIDNSGSMRDKRSAVNQASLNLVRA